MGRVQRFSIVTWLPEGSWSVGLEVRLEKPLMGLQEAMGVRSYLNTKLYKSKATIVVGTLSVLFVCTAEPRPLRRTDRCLDQTES